MRCLIGWITNEVLGSIGETNETTYCVFVIQFAMDFIVCDKLQYNLFETTWDYKPLSFYVTLS